MAQFEFEALQGVIPSEAVLSGVARDLTQLGSISTEIPRPDGKNAGLRDDTATELIQTQSGPVIKDAVP